MPSGCAAACMTAHCPTPAGAPGSRTTSTRLTSGATSSSSSHLALRLYSNCRNPVALLFSRARVSMFAGVHGVDLVREHYRHSSC